MTRAWLAVAVVAFASACGGSSDRTAGTKAADGHGGTIVSQTGSVLEQQFGAGADGFYLFTPRRRAWNSVVVFVHGHGDATEITPAHHRPWLRHLAVGGSAVVYPRYEEQPGGHDAARHVDVAVRSALRVLGARWRTAPIIGIGYSRGGRLIVDWAAIAAPAMKPRAIVSVFPASAEDPSPDLSRIRVGTRVLVLSGDQDEVVGPYGAAELLLALKESGFGLRSVRWDIVESTPDFAVTHLSVLESSPRARALFWKPTDRVIARVLAG